MSLQLTLDFLEDLSQNNNREWFQDHRKQYEAARAAFEQLLAEVVAKFDAVDTIPALPPKDLMFRINRDVRFSKDKSPYNTTMSALFGPQGKKSSHSYYYMQLGPRNDTAVVSGLKSPSSAHLKTVRAAIDADPDPLRQIIDKFVANGGQLYGEQVKTAPRGFSTDHPAIELLRYKEFMAERNFTDAEVVQDDFADQVVAACVALKPLRSYFDAVLGLREPS